jgi:hypothetical protein
MSSIRSVQWLSGPVLDWSNEQSEAAGQEDSGQWSKDAPEIGIMKYGCFVHYVRILKGGSTSSPRTEQ